MAVPLSLSFSLVAGTMFDLSSCHPPLSLSLSLSVSHSQQRRRTAREEGALALGLPLQALHPRPQRA